MLLTIYHSLSETAHAEYADKCPNGEEQNKSPYPATTIGMAGPGNPEGNEDFSDSKGENGNEGDVVGKLVVAKDYSTGRLVEHRAHVHNQGEESHCPQHTCDQLHCTLMSGHVCTCLVYVVLQLTVGATLYNRNNHTYHQHLSHVI